MPCPLSGCGWRCKFWLNVQGRACRNWWVPTRTGLARRSILAGRSSGWKMVGYLRYARPFAISATSLVPMLRGICFFLFPRFSLGITHKKPTIFKETENETNSQLYPRWYILVDAGWSWNMYLLMLPQRQSREVSPVFLSNDGMMMMEAMMQGAKNIIEAPLPGWWAGGTQGGSGSRILNLVHSDQRSVSPQHSADLV